MDDTFKMCPSLFYQVFTIHFLVNGLQFPVVYCLLQSKSRKVYNHTFTLIKESLQNIDLELNPHVRLWGCFASTNTHPIFPSAAHKACFYHFRPSIWKIQCLGLQQRYLSDLELRHAISKTAAIAFVLVHFVYIAWDGVVQDLEETNDPELKISSLHGWEVNTLVRCGISS